jgi:zinc transporter ZupT
MLSVLGARRQRRQRQAFALTGLVIHGVADGLALGVAHVAGSSSGDYKYSLPRGVFFFTKVNNLSNLWLIIYQN